MSRVCVLATLALLVGFGPQMRTLGGQTTPPPRDTALPRTPDGHPDLQGNWNMATLTPLERQPDLGNKGTWTDSEAAVIEQRTAERTAQRNAVEPGPTPARGGGAGVGTYNDFWTDGGTTLASFNGKKLTSLIIDPPDGRIPFTAAARDAQARARARYGVGPYNSYTDLDTGERCLTDGIPWTPFGYNNNYQIVQTRDHVSILREQFAELRIIPLERATMDSPTVNSWFGQSRGRWENDTLIVETTGFADKAHYEWGDPWRGARPTLTLTEHFTLANADTVYYQFTVVDPTTFTQPWTAVVPLTRTSERMFEYACHEGNVAIANVLRGARASEGRTSPK